VVLMHRVMLAGGHDNRSIQGYTQNSNVGTSHCLRTVLNGILSLE
jgi:hypothetical protein